MSSPRRVGLALATLKGAGAITINGRGRNINPADGRIAGVTESKTSETRKTQWGIGISQDRKGVEKKTTIGNGKMRDKADLCLQKGGMQSSLLNEEVGQITEKYKLLIPLLEGDKLPSPGAKNKDEGF